MPNQILSRIAIKSQKDRITFHIILILSFLLFFFYKHIYLTWDILGLILFLNTIWYRKGRQFLKNFFPAFFIIYGFLLFINIYKNQDQNIHITELIYWEKTLFNGTIPSAYLQQTITNPLAMKFTKTISNLFYLTHFINPFILSLIIWFRYRSQYWKFITGFLIMSVAGFITWYLYPAAPPWWATYFNYLTGDFAVNNISSISSEIMLKNWNPVAAMPSLHGAYSAYIALFSLYLWQKKAILIIILPLGIGFGAVYLGHHYVIDILAGYFYALVSFIITITLFKKHKSQTKTIQT